MSDLSINNQLLAALSPDVLYRLLPRLHPVPLKVRETIMVPNTKIEAVYFVESGWVSLVAVLEDGTHAEVGIVGREGMVGLPLVTGVDTAFVEAFVQADGAALRMEAAAFRRVLDEEPEFRALLLRYVEVMMAHVTQTAACNGRHGLEQRLCRWLLMAHDRADGDEFQMTQEFLSMMLVVYRPTVSIAARALQRAGLIQMGRGRITVLDREGLEASVCDCYANVNKRAVQLLGRDIKSDGYHRRQ